MTEVTDPTRPTVANALSPYAALLPIDERTRLAVQAVRRISMTTEPNEMIRDFERQTRWQTVSERWIAVSRRGLSDGWYRITRNTEWTEPIDPWKEPHRLPLLRGGLIADVLYSDEPRVINDLPDRLQPDDPAYAYLHTAGSMMAVHHFDQGHGLNMAVMLTGERDAFPLDRLPEQILVHNLFGRVVKVHLLTQQLQQVNDELDRELRVVGQLQRSLLPSRLPEIPGLQLDAHYDTARRAGGDYYDIFPLRDDCWGMLIADVSGHGTPAAVLMSVMHAIAHGFPGPHEPSGGLLEYVNERLVKAYTGDTGNFVTAFYGIFNPRTRRFVYSIAGHPPPRLMRAGSRDRASELRLEGLSSPAGPPLGVLPRLQYAEGETTLNPGDVLVLYTDGIMEAMNSGRELYGLARLDRALRAAGPDASPQRLVDCILEDVTKHMNGMGLADDRTLLVLRCSGE